MNWKPSFSASRARNFLIALAGLGLLAAFGFSLSALFASRSQQAPRTRGQTQTPISQHLSSGPSTTKDLTGPTVGWKTYANTTYGYSIKYPPEGEIKVGNAGQPTLPKDAIHVYSGQWGTVTIAVEEIKGDDKYTSSSFKEVSQGSQVTYTDVVQHDLNGRRAETTQEYIGGYQNKLIYTFFPIEKKVYYLSTVVVIDPKTGKPLRPEDKEQLKFYNQVLSTFMVKQP